MRYSERRTRTWCAPYSVLARSSTPLLSISTVPSDVRAALGQKCMNLLKLLLACQDDGNKMVTYRV